jgi:hypothetical protein
MMAPRCESPRDGLEHEDLDDIQGRQPTADDERAIRGIDPLSLIGSLGVMIEPRE